MHSLTIQERFLQKVDRRGDDECWPWLASTFQAGYGLFWMGGRNVNASRAAYELFVGSAGDHEVCHTCDNRWCTNYIKHLFLGTGSDNQQDMLRKGRGNKRQGETHPEAVLKAWQVNEFKQRCRLALNEVKKEYMDKYGVTESALRLIVSGKNWKGLSLGQ